MIGFELYVEGITDFSNDAVVQATHDGDCVVFECDEVFAAILDDEVFPGVTVEGEESWVMKDLRRCRARFVHAGATGQDEGELRVCFFMSRAVHVEDTGTRVFRFD